MEIPSCVFSSVCYTATTTTTTTTYFRTWGSGELFAVNVVAQMVPSGGLCPLGGADEGEPMRGGCEHHVKETMQMYVCN